MLVCPLPSVKETLGVLNKELFEQLSKGSYIINDVDLFGMLDTGHLSGAYLDVFHQEPLPADHSFWNHEKANITPHYASVSDTALVVPQIIEN